MRDRISGVWNALRSEGRKALIPYITPDVPVRGCTPDVVGALEQAGADMIEIGLPFSDPLADGPVIQEASGAALAAGVTPMRVLDIVAEVRRRTEIPLVLMGYVNTVLRPGPAEFFAAAARAGVDGCIIADLPPEESDDIRSAAASAGISMVFLIAPTSDDERIRLIDGCSTDFSYCVSITGVTGNQERFAHGSHLRGFLGRVRRTTSKPFVVGFGLSTPDDVRAVAPLADGVVVGSALLRRIGDARSADEAAGTAAAYMRTLRSAADESTTAGARIA